MALQIRRGLQANLPVSPADGELLYATDTNKLYVGDGGIAQEISGGAGASTLDGLSDVTLVGTPTNGQVLKYNGAAWSNSGDVGLINLVDDTTPQLGGNLDVNGNSIVSASNGNINITPNGTGNVVLHGDLIIDPLGNITKTGPLNISPTTILSIGNNTTLVDGNLFITRNTYSAVLGQGFTFAQHHATADATNFTFYKSRGTGEVPTVVLNGDDLADISFIGHDGTNRASGAAISATVEGSPTLGHIPTKISFVTDNGTTLLTRAELSAAGVWKTNTIQNFSGISLNLSGTGLVTATNAIIGNGAASPVAGTILTVNGTLTGALIVGSIISGGTTSFGTAITAVNSATFTSTINTTTLTVATVSAGTITVGMALTGGSVTAGTYIVAFVSGVNGGVGVYTLNQSATGTPTTGTSYTVSTSQLVTSTTVTSGGTVNLVGNVRILGQNSLRFADLDSSNYVAFKAPATVAADVTWTLPAADGTVGQMLATNGSGTLSWSSGGAGLFSRTTVSGTTASIADGVKADVTVANAYTGYILYKIETNVAAWVRVYVDIPSRTTDSTRLEGTDPLPGAGVVAEVITTGAQTILVSPGTIGFNNEVSPTTNIYLAVTNKSGSTTSVIVTLTILKIEA